MGGPPSPQRTSHRCPHKLLQTDNATKSVAINPHSFLVGGQQQCGSAPAAGAAVAADQEQLPPPIPA